MLLLRQQFPTVCRPVHVTDAGLPRKLAFSGKLLLAHVLSKGSSMAGTAEEAEANA